MLTAWACLVHCVQAALIVPPGGTPPITFDSTPPATDWATGVLLGNAATFSTVEQLDAAVAALDAATVVRALPTSGTVPPSTFSGGFRHNTTLLLLQSRPTTDGTNAAGVLKAMLQNQTGEPALFLTLTYDFAAQSPLAGELPGFHVYYSLDGLAGTWSKIPALSGSETPGVQTGTVDLSARPWMPGMSMFLLWVDDNANQITDPSYTLDNVVFQASGGQPPQFAPGQPTDTTVLQCRNLVLTSLPGGAPPPALQWFRNHAPLPDQTNATLTVANAQLSDGGLHYCRAQNLFGVAYSPTGLVTVVPDTQSPDILPPVTSVSPTEVAVQYSEPVDPATAQNPALYSVTRSDGVSLPVSAALLSNPGQVRLTLAQPLAAGATHTLTVAGVRDACALNPMPATSIEILTELRLLTLDDGAPWRFHQQGVDLGTAWREVGYADLDWPVGTAVFDGRRPPRTVVGGQPVRTQLVLTNANFPSNNIPTYYFRAHFNFPDDPAQPGRRLQLRAFLDDSALIYLNGMEAARIGLPPSVPVPFASYGAAIGGRTVGEAALEPPIELPLSAVVQGDNLIAVELKNVNATSSDITLGLELIATVSPPQLALPNRPFGIDADTYQAYTDGFFDVFIDDQVIGVYLLNRSPVALANVVAQASFPAGSGIVLLQSLETFGTLAPGVPTLGFFRADFTGSAPGRFPLTLHVTGGGLQEAVARDLFVVRSEHHPTDINRWTMYADVGKISTEALARYGGNNLGSLGVLTSFRQTVEYYTPFEGQFSRLPYSGAGDPWWKAFGLGFGLAGCAGWIVGAVVEGCGNERVGKALVNVGQAEKGAGGLLMAADEKDFFKRGQENTVPGPGEVTLREDIQAQGTFLDEPRVGAPARAQVVWSYQRTTRDNAGEIRTYPYALNEVVTNKHYTTGRTVTLNAHRFVPGEELVITTHLVGPEPLHGDKAYVVATLFRADDPGLSNVLRTVVLRDDGQRGDPAPGDGLYTGVASTAGLPLNTPMHVYVFGYDVNNAALDDPLAAQEIGGVLISPPEILACDLQPDAVILVGSDVVPTLFEGLDHASLGRANLAVVGTELEVSNLGASGQDGVSIGLGEVEGFTTVLPLDPAMVPPDGRMGSAFYGPNGEPRGSLGLHRTANGFEIPVDFGPIGSPTYTVRILDGDTLVAQQSGLSGTQVALQLAAPVQIKCKCVWWPPWKMKWRWCIRLPALPPVYIRAPFMFLASGQVVQGTDIEFVPDTVPTVAVPVARVDLTAAGLPGFRIAEENLQVLGADHRALGQARLLGQLGGQQLTVANLGSSGQDGVIVVDLPAGLTRWDAQIESLGRADDPGNPIPDGAYVDVTARGTVNGVADQVVSRVRHQDMGAEVRTQPDLSFVSEGPLHTTYSLSNAVVGTQTYGVGSAWRAIWWPCSFSISWGWRWWPPGWRVVDVDWDWWVVPVPVVPPFGLPLLADAVTVDAVPAAQFDGYSSVALTASRISQFTFTRQTVEIGPPNFAIQHPVLDAANRMLHFTVPTVDGLLYGIESTTIERTIYVWERRSTFTGDGTPMTVSMPVSGLTGEFFRVVASSTLPTVTVDCGVHGAIYENLTARAVDVTIQVADRCEDFSSELHVLDKDGTTTQSTTIADGATKSVTVTVPSKGKLRLDCNGSPGKCDYTISTP